MTVNPEQIIQQVYWSNDQELKGNKGQNPYFTSVFIRRIQVTIVKGVLLPDKVIFEILTLQVGIRSLGWDLRGRSPVKRPQYLHQSVRRAERRNLRPAQQAVPSYLWCRP